MFATHSQKNTLSTGRASIFQNSDLAFVSFTPAQAYSAEFYKFADAFADYGKFHSIIKQDMKPTRRFATIERSKIPGDWEGSGDHFYDDVTGLLMTTNMDVDTWENVSPDLKKQLLEAMNYAVSKGEHVAGAFDGETLVIKPVSLKGYELLKRYRDHDVVTSQVQGLGQPEVIIAYR